MRRFIFFVSVWLILLLVPGEMPRLSAQGPTGGMIGKPWRGAPGVTETIAQIMRREEKNPIPGSGEPRSVPRRRPLADRRRLADHTAAYASRPFTPETSTRSFFENAPQPVGTNFLGGQYSESNLVPPDSMGAVGPAQILVVMNGRIKVFDKSGNPGGLNANLSTFFAPVMGPSATLAFDPQARYDRLSGRWFVTALDDGNGFANGALYNRVMIASSSGAMITSTTSFTFFQFQHDQVGCPAGCPNPDTNGSADYDSLGIDAQSLYIGVNVFDSTGTPVDTTGFVVNKLDLLNHNSPVITAFRGLSACGFGCSGPWSPRGVDNDDPSASDGYFIGVDNANFSLLALRRVTYSASIPSISGNLLINVPSTSWPADVPALGWTTKIDAVGDRLFSAEIKKNKLTGISSLWTAHAIQIGSNGLACDDGSPFPTTPCPDGGRDAARWYELGNLSNNPPSLLQVGTLSDTAKTAPRFFWIPSVAASGQGHMALGASTSISDTSYAGVAVAGRLSTDISNATRSPSFPIAGAGPYNLVASGINRWGDYSQTSVDPNDDMTIWTFQEFAKSTNSWGVQVIQLKAPPPAAITLLAPATLPQGSYSSSVIITGTIVSGSGFFDPGPDSGGPGYLNHIQATVTGRVVVNNITFNSPTQITLNLNTVCATPGAKDLTVVNPDGQSVVSLGALMLTPAANGCRSSYFPFLSR